MKTKIFNLNLVLTLILIATGGFFIIRTSCSKVNKDTRANIPTNSSVTTPREAAAATNINNLQNKINDLEKERSNLIAQATAHQTDKESFTTNLASLQVENLNLATRLEKLEVEVSATKAAADLQNATFTSQLAAALQESNSNLLTRLTTSTTNQPAPAATPVTATALASTPTPPTTTTPAANPAPIAVPASANIIAVVTTSTTNSVIFYADGTVVKTNTPIGMVGGFPILVDNVSKEIIVLTVSRVPGPGSISLEVLNGTYLTLSLLEAEYKCSWRIKGEYKLAGSDTLNVRGGPPSDLVVGKGVFNGTLTLVDK